MFPVKQKENIFQWKNYKKLSSQRYREKTKQIRSKLPWVSDHRESEGLVQGRLKESTLDLIQEEV